MPVLGAATWVGALVGLLVPLRAIPVAVLALLAVLGVAARLLDRGVGRRLRAAGLPSAGPGAGPGTGQVVRTALAAGLLLAAAAGVATVHRVGTTTGPVSALADERASVRGELVVTGDPRERSGPFSDYVVVRGRLTVVEGRGRAWEVRSPVLVVAPSDWVDVPLGSRLAVSGRLVPAEGGDLAAVLRARADPEVLEPPDVWWRGAAEVRAALRESVDHRPPDQAVLVPSLVVGDDAGLDPALAEDFATTGLTHLLAVSGTNLTLITAFLLVLAQQVGVRGRGRVVVAVVGIVGFVLLARTEPSVVRAAAMGTVALLGMGRNGLRRGTRSLGVAVTVLLLFQPWLATTVGFALSVLATAGILLLAPSWRDALARWMPRWMAEAVAVPAAAQLACTPVVAGISGEVSIVAVLANMLVAPVVGPATVLGLAGGLVGLVWTPPSRVPGTVAAWCVGWIIAVARWGAALPLASVGWGTSVLALALLTAACLAAVPLAPRFLVRPRLVLLACALTAVVVLVRPPTPGWPPERWAVVACDVGQGDALVLRVGPGSAVVVDTGPDPASVDRCLDRLGVDHVALLVLTHFHDDHAGAVAGVLDGRDVDAIDVSPLDEPRTTADDVRDLAAARGIPVSVPAHGSVRQVGDVRLEVLGPLPGVVRPAAPAAGSPRQRDGEGSGANDASLVLLAEVAGVSVLLTGDVEPPAQRTLLRTVAARPGGVDVDVLKVPHHGSRHQVQELLAAVRAEVALVSVGADNTYGHPDPDLLHTLEAGGTRVFRTDLAGDLVVTRPTTEDGSVGVVTGRG
ncbi:MBL fold metallo-hydrolase [Nocardioides zeae]|uniref:MBL fold metallo-hydrolase n=2 Tax=Nocardioides zeae TaxID=1457234 RepID=A0A6P0HEP2_9ACTN|nr:ComEC/Rec2 family competence protein [Nocardioides zeae]NEN76824.1 MBL fold metallo-hydrolase [Nocardioides zeae]